MTQITSPDWIKINGRLCSDYGLYADTPQVPPSAKRRVNRIQLANIDDIVQNSDTSEDIKYTVNLYRFSDGKDFDNNAIYEFFNEAKTLEISRYPGFYFIINEIDEIAPDSSYNGKKIKYQVTFILAPYKYSVNPKEIVISTSYTPVENIGSAPLEPIIKIKLSKKSSGIIKGDVNFDGVIDATDASLVLNEYANVMSGKPPSFTEEQMIAADMNNDGVIDARDASIILDIYAKMSTQDPKKPSQYVEINTNGESLFVGVPGEVLNNAWEITVDCKLHLIYYTDSTGKMVNILHYSSLDLPTLHTGTNYIKYTGENVETVKVILQGRWR